MIPTMNLTTWAGLAAAGALVGTCWRSIRDAFARSTDLFIGKVALKEQAAQAVLARLWAEGSRSPFRVRVFSGVPAYVYPKRRVQTVAFESFSNTWTLLWVGRVPILVRNRSYSDSSDNTPPTTYSTNASTGTGLIEIMFLRGTLDIDAFIEGSIDRFNDRHTTKQLDAPRRFHIHKLSHTPASSRGDIQFGKAQSDSPARAMSQDLVTNLRDGELRLLTWQPDDLVQRSTTKAPFDLYPYTAEQLAVLPEIERWLKHGEWHRERGVPHRRGMLCHGQPGTGKSTFIKSVAIQFDLPLYVFDISTYDNAAFVRDWAVAQQDSPCIVLIEDLDCTYQGRTSLAQASQLHTPLTFDCLLNTISGVGISDGILLFVTTNRVETLDPALGVPSANSAVSTRPGRIDRTIHFGPMEEPQRRKLATFILSDCPEEVDATVAAGDGETAAQFQDRCAQLALRRFWGRAGSTSTDTPS